ncbi:endoribonuclease LACTB2 [Dermatophagoides farinae]|uniref:endoribonuclease LACTB2 n=1 Tax=Dermatophagoides farinae TaxID=6954 RepID=UPI003F604393
MTAVIPKISKLSRRVIRVLGCNPGHFTLQGTNTYIIGTGRDRLLIDCGEPEIPEYIQVLKNVVKENNILLTKILLTHWHPDHVGGTKSVLDEVAHKECKVFKYPNPNADDSITKGKYELNYLDDEDEIHVEGASLKVYFTPGHAKDHLVVFLKEENNLFSGDNILGEGSAVFEDLASYLHSLRKISSLKANKIYPSHGPVVNDPQKKVHEYIEHRVRKEEQILDVLSKTSDRFVSVDEIVKITYPNLKPGLAFGAQWNVLNHLEKLYNENRVEKQEVEDDIAKFRLKI